MYEAFKNEQVPIDLAASMFFEVVDSWKQCNVFKFDASELPSEKVIDENLALSIKTSIQGAEAKKNISKYWIKSEYLFYEILERARKKNLDPSTRRTNHVN